MQWWLTVFFLIGSNWMPGDGFDGWHSRAYETAAECESRRSFAEAQTGRFPLALEARWICSEGHPATTPPAALLNAQWESSPWPVKAQWYGHPGEPELDVFTAHDLAAIGPDGLGLRYEGPLKPMLAEELRKLLLTSPQRVKRVVLELDSNGGDLTVVRDLVGVLQQVRSRMELTTRVMEGAICASGCIPVFMQGERRKASSASVWVFHGARTEATNVPSRRATNDYLDMLTSSGLSPGFRAELEFGGRIFRPGSLILSGYEVFHVNNTGIIKELLPNWREEKPVLPSVTPSQ